MWNEFWKKPLPYSENPSWAGEQVSAMECIPNPKWYIACS